MEIVQNEMAKYAVSPALDLSGLPFRTDAGIGTRGAVGLLVLKTDQTIEHEFRAVWPRDGVGLYAARLHNDATITPQTLRAMEPLIAPATALLPPVELGAIGFACTSGALMIGEATVAGHVRSVRPQVAVSDPVTAALAALRALGARRVALLTPYTRAITLALREKLMARGLEIPAVGSFEEEDDAVVARITPDSVMEAVLRLGAHEACEAVFVSCTSLRVAAIVEAAEAHLGRPVTSSNHALAWHLLRLAGIDDAIQGFGRLYGTRLTA
ncbi:MAG: Asp/Glu racemase [Acetobacteraceae bacterium]